MLEVTTNTYLSNSLLYFFFTVNLMPTVTEMYSHIDKLCLLYLDGTQIHNQHFSNSRPLSFVGNLTGVFLSLMERILCSAVFTKHEYPPNYHNRTLSVYYVFFLGHDSYPPFSHAYFLLYFQYPYYMSTAFFHYLFHCHHGILAECKIGW